MCQESQCIHDRVSLHLHFHFVSSLLRNSQYWLLTNGCLCAESGSGFLVWVSMVLWLVPSQPITSFMLSLPFRSCHAQAHHSSTPCLLPSPSLPIPQDSALFKKKKKKKKKERKEKDKNSIVKPFWDQKSANFFFFFLTVRPDSKYVQLCGPCTLSTLVASQLCHYMIKAATGQYVNERPCSRKHY